MSRRKPLTAAALSLSACLLALQLAPRALELPGLTMRDLDPIGHELSKANIEPHPYLAYANRPHYKSREGAKRQVSHNALGFRGPEIRQPKPEGTFRIVCLGGSSTYGHGPSSDQTTWPARLQTRLRASRPGRDIEVINAGCRGYSTFESLGNYTFRVSDLDPDLVVIYHTVNDMRCALYLGVQRDNTHWRSVWRDLPRSPLEASYTYLIWRRYLTDHFERIGDIGNFVIVDFQENLAASSEGERPPAYQIKGDTELGYRNFHRNLQALNALAKSDGARIAFGTQAVLKQRTASEEDQVLAFEQMTAIVRKVAADSGGLLVDVQAGVAAEQSRRQADGEPSLFIKSPDVVEVHLTDDGADVVARLFADALLTAGL